MSSNRAIAKPSSVKGWCPGALRPMQTGDGWIVRVRPRSGVLRVPQLLGVSEIALRHGNGLIDLTRRANLQIRGVQQRDLPSLWTTLSEYGLIDAHADAEAVRNVVVSPLAGIDPTEIANVRPMAAALEAMLGETAALWSLPGKFGFAVDGGGLLPLDNETADIRLKAAIVGDGTGVAIGIDTAQGTEWLRLLEAKSAQKAAAQLAMAFVALPKRHPRARMCDLEPCAIAILRETLKDWGVPIVSQPQDEAPASNRVGRIETRGNLIAVGIGAPFGRLTAKALKRISEAAAEVGIATLRVSPWRVLYAPVADGENASRLLDGAEAAGLVVKPTDPLLAIDACPGAPACSSAFEDTRAAALRVAAMWPLPAVGSVHISGCAKGCARSRNADLVLVAGSEGFGVIRCGTAGMLPGAFLTRDDLHGLPAILRTGAR